MEKETFQTAGSQNVNTQVFSYDKCSERDHEEDLLAVFSDDDSDAREIDEEVPRKRSKKSERKVPLSEEESERKRVLANSQERERMNRLNRALNSLRRALPSEFSASNRRLSKIRTLRLAINYIRGLSTMLAEDKARVEAIPCTQPPQYPSYPPAASYPVMQQVVPGTPELPTRVPSFLGGEEGYFSFNDSHTPDTTSFLGASTYPSTPATPYFFPHPPLHLVSSPDEGYASSFLSSSSAAYSGGARTPVFSPGGWPWVTSTPAGGQSAGRFPSMSTSINDSPYTSVEDPGSGSFLQPCLGEDAVRMTSPEVTSLRSQPGQLPEFESPSPSAFPMPTLRAMTSSSSSRCPPLWSTPCPPADATFL